MDVRTESWQWSMAVVVYHGPGFGHRLELITQQKAHDAVKTKLGNWNTLGVPETVMAFANATLQAALTNHLVERYGVAGELPIKWAGEPDPF